MGKTIILEKGLVNLSYHGWDHYRYSDYELKHNAIKHYLGDKISDNFSFKEFKNSYHVVDEEYEK